MGQHMVLLCFRRVRMFDMRAKKMREARKGDDGRLRLRFSGPGTGTVGTVLRRREHSAWLLVCRPDFRRMRCRAPL